jgi:hypothetical protein
VKLTFKPLELRLTHKWTIARTRGTDTSPVVVVELTSADGTVGRGEAAPSSRYKESAKSVEAFLQKIDPRGLSFNDVEGSMAYLETVSDRDMSAKPGVAGRRGPAGGEIGLRFPRGGSPRGAARDLVHHWH